MMFTANRFSIVIDSDGEMQKKMTITKKLTCRSGMLCACCIVHHLQWSILQAILPDNPSIEQIKIKAYLQ